MKALIIIIAALLLSACDSTTNTSLNNQKIVTGKQVFKKNCLSCHGENATGEVKTWQKPGPDGKYPAPPLNGTAHAWHHNKKVLLATIDRGGIPLGGTIPAFKETLNNDQKEAVLVYIQNLWPDEIYQT